MKPSPPQIAGSLRKPYYFWGRAGEGRGGGTGGGDGGGGGSIILGQTLERANEGH